MTTTWALTACGICPRREIFVFLALTLLSLFSLIQSNLSETLKLDFRYRNRTDWKMPGNDEFPLTVEMMKLGMQNINLDLMVGKFDLLFGKLSRGETVHLAVIGGSFPHNAPATSTSKESFFFMFCSWLRHSFPVATIHGWSLAVPSTRSEYAMHHLKEKADRQHYDLMFVAYAANDNTDVGVSDQIVIGTEFIIRSMLKRQTALIYISENPASGHAEEVYLRIATRYHVPVLSYRNATRQHLNDHPPPQHNVFWLKAFVDSHPPPSVHQLVCDMAAHLFCLLVQHRQLHPLPPTRQQGATTDLAAVWALPSKLYVDDEDACGSSTSMSSLPDTPTTSSFVPFSLPGVSNCTLKRYNSNSALLQTHPCSSQEDLGECSLPYYHGWRYFADRPGKPPGWIADSTTREPHSLAHIAFFMLSGKGKFFISYLSTYRNAGVFEVWMSSPYPKWNLVACRSKRDPYRGDWFHPNTEKREVTKRVLTVDTYQNRSKVSNMDTITLSFGCRNTMLVNIVHKPLPGEEFARRGGDKVKIMGLRGC